MPNIKPTGNNTVHTQYSPFFAQVLYKFKQITGRRNLIPFPELTLRATTSPFQQSNYCFWNDLTSRFGLTLTSCRISGESVYLFSITGNRYALSTYAPLVFGWIPGEKRRISRGNRGIFNYFPYNRIGAFRFYGVSAATLTRAVYELT